MKALLHKELAFIENHHDKLKKHLTGFRKSHSFIQKIRQQTVSCNKPRPDRRHTKKCEQLDDTLRIRQKEELLTYEQLGDTLEQFSLTCDGETP